MRTIGFPISRKENENRRALLPCDLKNVANKTKIYIEKGYGVNLGFDDSEYKSSGINVVDREEVLKQDIICDPKIGDADYLSSLYNQTIFGWIHAVQNENITNTILTHNLTAYAWENMYNAGRHVFWRNNEIAGEAAIIHAYLLFGKFPYNTKVAILGRGNTSRGALKTLTYMGADVTIYDRKTEELFRKELYLYDVVVNAILWDTHRSDHIIYRKDLHKMKKGAMIIDISCDKNGGIETSIPTTIENPIYSIDNVLHYVVDHTPSLFYKTISESLSKEVAIYLDSLITDTQNTILEAACIIKESQIIDNHIIEFQHRNK